MGMQITLTFKDDEKWLYEEICTHSSKVGYIKDILKDNIKNPSNNKNRENQMPKGLDLENILNGI